LVGRWFLESDVSINESFLFFPKILRYAHTTTRPATFSREAARANARVGRDALSGKQVVELLAHRARIRRVVLTPIALLAQVWDEAAALVAFFWTISPLTSIARKRSFATCTGHTGRVHHLPRWANNVGCVHAHCVLQDSLLPARDALSVLRRGCRFKIFAVRCWHNFCKFASAAVFLDRAVRPQLLTIALSAIVGEAPTFASTLRAASTFGEPSNRRVAFRAFNCT